MSTYIVARISIHDRARYAEYEAGFMAVFQRFQGRMLAVDENHEVLEGDWPATRTVLISFPSAAAAREWYQSDDYQALMQHRLAASTGDIAMLAGLESPAA